MLGHAHQQSAVPAGHSSRRSSSAQRQQPRAHPDFPNTSVVNGHCKAGQVEDPDCHRNACPSAVVAMVYLDPRKRNP